MKPKKINFSDIPDPVGKMKRTGMRPVPPGEILNEEFLKPLGLTANALAKAIGVLANRITAILKDERGITGDTAIRLGTFFKTSAEFWMNLQMTYDLRNAEKALPARVRKSIEDNRSVLAWYARLTMAKARSMAAVSVLKGLKVSIVESLKPMTSKMHQCKT